jgi:hypothetical protein
MATNDTKVHTRDAQLPPIPKAMENRKPTCNLSRRLKQMDEAFRQNFRTAERNGLAHFPTRNEKLRGRAA